MNVLIFKSDVNLKRFAKQILRNEPKIIKKYPPTNCRNVKTDGETGLGYDSLTSRFYHFNILNWLNTNQLKKEIRKGYESYTNVNNTPLFVQCWANVMRRCDRIKPHVHMNSNISPLHALSGHLCVKVDSSTNTYYGGKPVRNVNGEMIFFPGTMTHWTDTYMGDSERITVAFDIFSEKRFNHDIVEHAKKHFVRI
tara:strand:+ start:138 stop:725 length:588 start_codon:yes stop_codon:yes gene_type:complete